MPTCHYGRRRKSAGFFAFFFFLSFFLFLSLLPTEWIGRRAASKQERLEGSCMQCTIPVDIVIVNLTS